MIGAVRAWLVGLIAASLLVSVADSLLPEGGVKKIAGFTGGLILLLSLIQPVLHIQPGSVAEGLGDYSAQIEALQESYTEKNKETLEQLIADKTQAYIEDKATGLGLVCSPVVTVALDESGVPYPAEAALDCPENEALAALLETDLGISRERQTWKGT